MWLYITTGKDPALKNNMSVYNTQSRWRIKAPYTHGCHLFKRGEASSEFIRGRLHGGSPSEKMASVDMTQKTLLQIMLHTKLNQ